MGIIEQAQVIEEQLIKWRRQIHQNPELGFEEYETTQYIGRVLTKLGYHDIQWTYPTGLYVDLVKGEGPCLLIRADIDALPVQEETNATYTSCHQGIMHACGHDAHAAMLLGVAALLPEVDYQGTVRLCFQPSEEGIYSDPDGFSGAQRMIHDGVLNSVDYALSLHQVPTMPTGLISIKPGPVMAASDIFTLTINGKIAHGGATPEEGVDAIVMAAELVQSIQTIVSRQIAHAKSAVVSIGRISGGDASHMVADTVVMEGTIRTMDQDLRDEIHQQIRRRCDAITTIYGGRIDFYVSHTIPVTNNDPALTKLCDQAATKVFSAQGVLNHVSTMRGEDFAYFANQVPGCFALLGARPEGDIYPLHHSKMHLNELALPKGVAYFLQCVDTILNKD